MVKSPKIQHSKTSARPVTIDLGADEVSRIQPGQARPEGVSDAATAKPADAAKADSPKPAAGAAASTTSDSAARPPKSSGAVPPVGRSAGAAGPSEAQKPAEPQKPRDEQPKPEPRPGSGGSAFGRDATSKPSTPPPPPPRPDGPQRRGAGSVIAAGLLGGAVVLAGAAGAYYGGFLPSGQVAPVTGSGETEALRAEIDSLKSGIAELRSAPAATGGDAAGLADVNARIESVSVLVEEMRAQLSQLAESVGANGSGGNVAAFDELRSALSTLEQRVASLPAEGNGDAEALRAEITRVGESATTAIQSAASATEAAGAAQARIEAVEQRLTELAAHVEEQDKTPGVALAIAASALKAAIDRGTPFMTELETYAGLAPDAPEVAALRAMAASGVPTRAAIASETDATAVRMIEAGRVIDPNAGFFDRLWASAQSLVTVRPVGEVEGSDVPAVVARWEASLDAGDYERAIAEYETLPQDAKAAGAALMDKVRARQSADRLVDQTLSAALRA